MRGKVYNRDGKRGDRWQDRRSLANISSIKQRRCYLIRNVTRWSNPFAIPIHPCETAKHQPSQAANTPQKRNTTSSAIIQQVDCIGSEKSCLDLPAFCIAQRHPHSISSAPFAPLPNPGFSISIIDFVNMDHYAPNAEPLPRIRSHLIVAVAPRWNECFDFNLFYH